MAFNPNDMTTDGMMGGWWSKQSKRVAENTLLNACCESQLILAKYNLEKISKQFAAIPSNEKLFDFPECERNELLMWYNTIDCIRQVDTENVSPNNTKSCDEIQALVNDITAKYCARRNNVTNTLKSEERDRIRIVNATEIDFVIHRKDGTSETHKISILDEASIFDEMKKWFEFNKWGDLMLCGPGIEKHFKEKLNCTPESEKHHIDVDIRNIIRKYQLEGVLLCVDMLERAPDEKIELQEVEMDGDDGDDRAYGASIPIPIQTSLGSNSMFDAIGRHFDQNQWLGVWLGDGKKDATHEVGLYEPTFLMKDSIAERKDEFDRVMKRSIAEQKDEFDRAFMAGIDKLRKKGIIGIKICMFTKYSLPINVVVYDTNGSQRTEKITLRRSIFDQLTKCVEFNKWESVRLCGGDDEVHENFDVYEIGSKTEFEKDMFKGGCVDGMIESMFNIEMKRYIWDACFLKGFVLHFEILESAPDIENQRIEEIPAVVELDQPPNLTFSHGLGNGKPDVLAARFQSVTWV